MGLESPRFRASKKTHFRLVFAPTCARRKPSRMIARAPRPCLLLHTRHDTLTAPESLNDMLFAPSPSPSAASARSRLSITCRGARQTCNLLPFKGQQVPDGYILDMASSQEQRGPDTSQRFSTLIIQCRTVTYHSKDCVRPGAPLVHVGLANVPVRCSGQHMTHI
jgi:hypothetical protein